MNIIVDINHPADVHNFKHFIWEMESRGHKILITASEKDVSYRLLDAYGFQYRKMGKYGTGIIRKLLNLPIIDFRLLLVAHSFKPDLFIGHSSIRSSHVSALMGVPCIITDDTEHAKNERLLYLPFTDYVLTPGSFTINLGTKHHYFEGYKELLYLHPSRFTPDPTVLEEIGLTTTDKFIVVRFVSWDATHDLGQAGIKEKTKLIKELEKYAKVLVSSESDVPSELEKNVLKISPDKLHSLLYYATLYVGEGATIAAESAVLGTHAVYVNSLPLGYIEELDRRYGLVTRFTGREEQDDITNEVIRLLQIEDLKENGRKKRDKILSEKIDVTKYLIEFVEKRFIQ